MKINGQFHVPSALSMGNELLVPRVRVQ